MAKNTDIRRKLQDNKGKTGTTEDDRKKTNIDKPLTSTLLTSTFVFRSGGFAFGGFQLEWSLVASSHFLRNKSARGEPSSTKSQGGQIRIANGLDFKSPTIWASKPALDLRCNKYRTEFYTPPPPWRCPSRATKTWGCAKFLLRRASKCIPPPLAGA